MKRNKKQKMKKRLLIAGGILLAIVVALIVAFYVYTLDYYRASQEVDELIEASGLNIEEEDGFYLVHPLDENDSGEGILFYPGGKVEAIAYMPLLLQLAEEGYTCVLVEMPFNLAVFNIKGADKVLEQVDGIDEWYMMGHSLGGAMASTYMEGNESKFEGLILLGAYPVNEADIETLAIYGTYDIMLDLDKVEEADIVHEIVDGNHAQFGNYGNQEGDGQAKISRQAQQEEAVEVITDFIESHH